LPSAPPEIILEKTNIPKNPVSFFMNKTASDSERQFLNNLENHLQNIPTECPYGLPRQAMYGMARFSDIPADIMGILLAAGYRRYGNSIYTMRCKNCRSCIPIKLEPVEFSANRSQRRCAQRNRDLSIARMPLTPDKEGITLLQRFFDSRYPGKNNQAADYYAGFFLNSAHFSMEIRLYAGKDLVGSSIVDVGRTWLNAVYFSFAPESAKRGLGVFNIINLIEFCKEQNIPNLYLGYWLAECRAMNYKAAFLPHYILRDDDWRKVQPPSTKPAITARNNATIGARKPPVS
jgi:arginine-tRNA-protein transferase